MALRPCLEYPGKYYEFLIYEINQLKGKCNYGFHSSGVVIMASNKSQI